MENWKGDADWWRDSATEMEDGELEASRTPPSNASSYELQIASPLSQLQQDDNSDKLSVVDDCGSEGSHETVLVPDSREEESSETVTTITTPTRDGSELTWELKSRFFPGFDKDGMELQRGEGLGKEVYFWIPTGARPTASGGMAALTEHNNFTMNPNARSAPSASLGAPPPPDFSMAGILVDIKPQIPELREKRRYKKRGMPAELSISYKCYYCDKYFSQKAMALRHEVVHKEGEFICQVCGISFRYPATLTIHRKNAHPQQHAALVAKQKELKETAAADSTKGAKRGPKPKIIKTEKED